MADLIVALDVPTADDALAMVDRLGDAVDRYKVGAPLFTRAGPSIIETLRARDKRVFLDLKYHDIPHTVARAAEAAAAMGVELLTLHASGGRAMLRAAREAVGEEGPRLLAVTLLTSMGVSELEAVWGRETRSLREDVFRLAELAAESGLDGVVASALEAEPLKRRHGEDFLVVTPGIRPSGAEAGDQVRTATPADAVEAGSDFLVVGRPILRATDPAKAAAAILEEIGWKRKPVDR
ncbi:MAG: orotidine-5'-phosphate decarboxylase [Gemmatimonadota bacterium]